MNSIKPVVMIALLLCCTVAGTDLSLAQTSANSSNKGSEDSIKALAVTEQSESSGSSAETNESITSDTSQPIGDLIDYRAWARSRRGATPMLDAAVRMNTSERDWGRWRERIGRGSKFRQQSDSRFATQSATAVPIEEEETGSSGGSGLFGSIFGDIAGLSGTQAELKNVRNRMSQLVQPLQNLQQPIDSLREPINQLSEPISGLQEPLKGTKESISDLKQPITDLKQPMSDLRQPLTDLRQPMLELKEGLQRPMVGLQKPLSELNMGTRQLSAPLNRMTGELDQLQRPMNSIGQPLQQLAPSMNGLPEPIQSLSGSVSALKSEVSGLHSELGDLRQSILDISRNISVAVIVASFVVGAAVIISRKVASRQQPTRTFVEQVVEDRPIDMAPPVEHSHLSGPGPYDIAPHGHMPTSVVEHLHGRKEHVVKTVMKTVPVPESEVEEDEQRHGVAAKNHELPKDDVTERDRYHGL